MSQVAWKWWRGWKTPSMRKRTDLSSSIRHEVEFLSNNLKKNSSAWEIRQSNSLLKRMKKG